MCVWDRYELKRKVQTIKSALNISIGPDCVYFSGGYITQRHSSSCIKEGIDGIQVEIPRDLRIDGGEEGRKRVGHALGKAISDFHHFHYIASAEEHELE